MGEERQVTWLSLSVCWGHEAWRFCVQRRRRNWWGPREKHAVGIGNRVRQVEKLQRKRARPGPGDRGVLVMRVCAGSGGRGWPREQWEKPLGESQV